MNCRVCNQPLTHLLTYENMPARAQFLHDTPEEDMVTLELCQCQGCGLVQLDNEPVPYWDKQVRTESPEMSERVKKLSEGMDFVSLNYLEHQPDPNKYLRELNRWGVIEVPNFDMIMDNGLFAEIMLDHLLYFTEDTLRFTLQYNGFEVINIGVDWDKYILSAEVYQRQNHNLDHFSSMQNNLKCDLDAFISQYDSVVIYGASHQAFSIIALCQPDVDFVIDDAKFKQDKYTPVGGIPIVSKAYLEGADAVIVIGGGYTDEILKGLDFEGGIAAVRKGKLELIRN